MKRKEYIDYHKDWKLWKLSIKLGHFENRILQMIKVGESRKSNTFNGLKYRRSILRSLVLDKLKLWKEKPNNDDVKTSFDDASKYNKDDIELES